MEQMSYPIPQKAQQEDDADAKKATPRAPQEKFSSERGNGLNPSPTKDAGIESSPTKKRLAYLNTLARQTNAAQDKIKGKVR
jgi:hypothetical protein